MAVPEGALLEADELVVRRVGVAEPRPGFTDNGTGCDLDSLFAILPFGTSGTSGRHLSVGSYIGEDTLEYDATFWAAGNDEVLDEDGNSLQWSVDHIRAVETRGNLYLATADTPRKYVTAGDVVALATGAIPPCLYVYPLSSGTGTALEDTYRVSLRAVLKRTDANGVVTYSAPSGRVICQNDSAATRDLEFRVSWRGARSGDVVQVYKSEVTTSDTPDDVHFLVWEQEVTTESGTIGTITDGTTNDDLGKSLNDLQNVQDPNWRAPASYDVALYAGSLFFIGSKDHARKTVRYVDAPLSLSTENGIGLRSRSGDFVNNSTLVTNLSSVDGLREGMLVLDTTDFLGTGPVYITGISGTSVSLSEGWDGTTATHGIIFYDSIKLNGDYYPAVSAAELVECVFAGSDAARFRCAASASVFAVGIGALATFVGDASSDWLGAGREVVFECINALDSFEISATHGSEYDPPLPEIEDNTPEDVEPDEQRNVLWWTRQYEPEHRLLSSMQEVGNSAPLLRGIATRDAIWLLKGRGDGVYRLSGAGSSSGFRIDQVDSSTFLLHPNLALGFEERAYAWTNKGLVSISDEGVIPLTEQVIGSDLRALQSLLSHSAEFPGAFAVAIPKTGELVFGLPPDSSGSRDGCASRVYVFNTRTKGLTKWFVGLQEYSCAAYLPLQGKLAFGRLDSSTPRLERVASEGIVAADRRFTGITVSAVSGTDVTISVEGYSADGDVWEPAVGDLFVRGAFFGVITEVTDETHFAVHATGLTTGTGAGAYEAFTCRMSWVAKTGEGPAGLKKYAELVAHFEDVYGLYSWDVIVTSQTNYASPETLTYTRTWARSSLPDDKRALIPRSHAVTSRLFPTLSIRCADARWRLAGISLAHEPLGTRVSR